MTRSEAKEEAIRLTNLVGREIDIRTQDCPCDYWKFCPTCEGSGSYPELFFTFCDHKYEEEERDGDCYDEFCAERERARREMEHAA